jgi:hypothetical protein
VNEENQWKGWNNLQKASKQSNKRLFDHQNKKALKRDRYSDRNENSEVFAKMNQRVKWV